MNGTIRILNENELLHQHSDDAVFPVTSDLAVYNTLNVSAADYVPYINVHAFTRKDYTAFTRKSDARHRIPAKYRHQGMILTYYCKADSETDPIWYSEQFYGTLTEDTVWEDDNSWKPVYSGAGSGFSADCVLNTDNVESQSPNGGELFDHIINLHKVSKTGKNIDLIDFVGKRDLYGGGETFTTYVSTDEYGERNLAGGFGTSVFGHNNKARNEALFSFIIGGNNTVAAPYSFTGGFYNTIEAGNAIFCFGKNNESTDTAREAVVFGNSNKVSGTGSSVFGLSNRSIGSGQTVIGRYNYFIEYPGIEDRNDYADYGGFDAFAFIIGNGTSDANRSNAFSVLWNGTAWAESDVWCGGEYNNPEHKLSEKYDISDLITNIDINSTVEGPASIQAVVDLYRQFVGDHRTYFFNSTKDMVDSLNHPDDYLVGDMMYIVNEEYDGTEMVYPAFFIANISTDWATYPIEDAPVTLEQLLIDIHNAVSQSGDYASTGLGIGYYRIGRLVNSITFGDWQNTLYDRVMFANSQFQDENLINFKTINGESLLYNANRDNDNIDITIPVSDTVDPDSDDAVSAGAVYNYINENTVAVTNLKQVDTTSTESLGPDVESLIKPVDRPADSNDNLLMLHRVSKTGVNTDLVDYVGRRYIGNPTIPDTAEIFNHYPSREPGNNKAFAPYSHVEGHSNSAEENAYSSHIEGGDNTSNYSYTHIGGQGNIAPCKYSTVIGSYSDTSSRIAGKQPLFVIGNGDDDNSRSNAFVVYHNGIVWSQDKMYVGDCVTTGDDFSESVPVVQITSDDSPNVLVNKYYVDNLFNTAGLYHGIVNTVSDIDIANSLNGSLYNVREISVSRNVNGIRTSVTKQNVMHVKNATTNTGVNLVGLYDILTFSDNPKQDPFYIIGGYKGDAPQTDETAKDIELHTVAQTGNYYDLKNRPSFAGLPTTHIKFNELGIIGHEPEPQIVDATQWPCEYYVDNEIVLVFDCDPQWVCDSILNNSSCDYYVYLQRIHKGQWKTVRYTGTGVMVPYRSRIVPKNLHTLATERTQGAPRVINAELNDGVWTVADQNRKIGFILPYTVRDLFMSYIGFVENHASCLWDLIVKGNSMSGTSTNFNATFDKKHFMLKGLENCVEGDNYIDMNAFAVHYRIGVVEQKSDNDKMFYGPSMWNNFKAMLTNRYKKFNGVMTNTMACLGKFTSRKIRT